MKHGSWYKESHFGSLSTKGDGYLSEHVSTHVYMYKNACALSTHKHIKLLQKSYYSRMVAALFRQWSLESFRIKKEDELIFRGML